MQTKGNQSQKEIILSLFEESLQKKKNLLESSVNKNIVIFLGNTGSGKSTLINYLANKPLKVIDPINTQIGSYGGKIVLTHPNDTEALKIGSSVVSETLFPQYLRIYDELKSEEIFLFDFPGFGDNRGFAVNILNAYFTKKIIEAADSVKFAFTCSFDEIKAERGKSFNELLANAAKLFGEGDESKGEKLIIQSSCLVITKTPANHDQTISEIKPFIKSSFLNCLIEGNKIAIMPIPFNALVSQNEKQIIWNLICNSLTPAKINSINISSTFKDKEKSQIESLLREEIDSIESLCLENANTKLKKYSEMKGFLKAKAAFDDFFNTKPTYIFKLKKLVWQKISESQIIKIVYPAIEHLLDETKDNYDQKLKKNQMSIIAKFQEKFNENQTELDHIKITRHVGSSFGADTKGNLLSDWEFVKNGEPITAWEIGHAGAIDSIRFKYWDQWGHFHGGHGGRKDFVALNPNERIVSVFVSSGCAVYKIELVTSEGRKFVYGKGGGTFKNEFIRFEKSLAYITSQKGNWYLYTFEYLVSALNFFEAPYR